MAGNLLGNKSKYGYTDDRGVDRRITRDDDLATAAGLTILIGAGTSRPGLEKGQEPRGVWCQALEDVGGYRPRKFLICNTDSPLWTAAGPTAVTIDTIAFITTGRVGEKQRFI